MKFSIVSTDRQQIPHLTVKPAEWFFERILTDTKAGVVQKLRQYILDFGDTGGFEQMTPVPRVYPLVELVKTQNDNLEVVGFNSMVVLHVGDLLRLGDVEAVKEAAKMLPMTYAALMGADGRSVEILVAVGSADMKPATEQEMDRFCKIAYEAAYSVYSGIVVKPIERQAMVARYSFRMTQDAQPYFNPAATPLMISNSRLYPAEEGTKQKAEQRETDMNLYAVYEQMYKRAAEEALDATEETDIRLRYEDYLTELARRLCQMGLPEEEAFLHMRSHHFRKETYNEDVMRSIVAAVYAEESPRRHHEKTTVSQETRRLINFLTTRFVFRFNTVMGYTEYRPNNTWIQDWQPCDENAINGLTIDARLAGLDVKDKDVRRYVHSNMIPECDPIADFIFNASGKWDGETDHIAMLARCVSCDIPQWEKWFRKWFLAMVAQWLLPSQEYGNSLVPLLISSQGDGKTTFCRMILPKELRWGFMENLDVSEKRQTLQAMHNFLLINLDEFNQISPKLQEGFLKNVIQLPSVKIKRPYGRHVEEFKRYASFIATTNESSVLSDPTGNRRFICVQLTAPVNTSYKPNYEALYDQAYTLIMRHKEEWWLTAEEVKAVMEHNHQYEQIPLAVQYFNEYYEIATDETDGQWLSPTTIYDNLRSIPGNSLEKNGASKFGGYLKNMPNMKHKRLSAGRIYLVRLKKELPTPAGARLHSVRR